MPEMMTTREVADYLRIKQRKVYELVRNGDIPCTRVTGKWLFPRHLIDVWLLQGTEGPGVAPAVAPPPIVAGSQDPLLDWALRESGCELAMLAGGSTAGLELLAQRRALAAGLHLLDEDSGEYNVHAVRRALGGREVVAVQWAWRRQGLVVAPGNPLAIAGIADLARPGLRIARRQEGSGSALLFRHLLAREGLAPEDLSLLDEVAKGETELGLSVLAGDADAGLAIEAAARRLKLDFVPLARERYDLVVGRRDYFEPPFQKLLAFAATESFRRHADELGGYDIDRLGQVVDNGP